MNQQTWLIGGSDECDLVLDLPQVSSRHCRLSLTAEGYVLEDLQSTNGTFLNGYRIDAPMLVTRNDAITLGQTIPFPWPEIPDDDPYELAPVELPVKLPAATPPSPPTDNVPPLDDEFEQSAQSPADEAHPTQARPQSTRRISRRGLEMLIGVVVLAVLGAAAWGVFRWTSDAMYRPVDNRELDRFKKHKGGVYCLTLSADGKIGVSGGEDQLVRIWSTKTGKDVTVLEGHSSRISAVAFSADGKRIVSGSYDGTVCVWNREDGALLCRFQRESDPITSVAFYPAGTHVAAGGRSGMICMWQLEEKKEYRRFAGHSGAVNFVAFTPDRLHLVSGSADGTVRVWHVASGNEVQQMLGHGKGVTGVSLEMDGGHALSSGDDGNLMVWDLKSGADAGVWRCGGSERIKQKGVCYSPGATRALSAGADGLLRLWSCESGQVLTQYEGHLDDVTCCAFFPNSLVAVSGGLDGTVRLWRVRLATEQEGMKIKQAAGEWKKQAGALVRYADQMKRGKGILDKLPLEELEKKEPDEETLKKIDDQQLAEAEAAFLAARDEVHRESIEYQAADESAQKVSDLRNDVVAGREKKQNYIAHCEAGKKAAEDQDLDRAVREFELAQRIFPDRPEAKEGLDKARQAQQTKAQFATLKATGAELGWEDRLATDNLLSKGREFAYLLTSKTDPPISLASDRLAWTIRMESQVAMGESDVKFQVRLSQKSPDRELAREEFPFKTGTKKQAFSGNFPPPEGGWQSGDYVFSSYLATPDETTSCGPAKTVQMGLVRWVGTELELTPHDVQQSGYEVFSVSPASGEGYCIEATGEVTPATLDFYRDLLNDRRLPEPIPAPPEGIGWTAHPKVQFYGIVENKSRYAALLYRRGSEKWKAYQGRTPVRLSRGGGRLSFSINSVVQKRKTVNGPLLPLPPSDRLYWKEEGGAFLVSILIGKFDFPLDLPTRYREHMLKSY